MQWDRREQNFLSQGSRHFVYNASRPQKQIGLCQQWHDTLHTIRTVMSIHVFIDPALHVSVWKNLN